MRVTTALLNRNIMCKGKYLSRIPSKFLSAINSSFIPFNLLSGIDVNANKRKSEIYSRHDAFFQEKPILGNPYSDDSPLQRFLKRHIPSEALVEIVKDLETFGDYVASDLRHIGRECELQPPHLVSQNAWGQWIDQLWTCEAWKKQHDISSKEGLVALGYERKHNEWSRLHQFSKLYLYAPAAGLYTCPLAMTDGAAKTIEVIGGNNPIFMEAYSKLISRDPKSFWTSGQWMTERKGGSDVAGGTETVAVPHESDQYKLYGNKWFSSALDSNMALTLARIVQKDDSVKKGTEGLTMFYLETRPHGLMNNIQIVKLKDKLGTRQLPTAELLLDGALAYKMCEEGCGVSGISNMLTITRIHNAVAAVAVMRGILRLARDYSQRRIAFGHEIGKFPLHMQTLARMEVETRGSMFLLLKLAIWLGKADCGVATDENLLLLRLMSPILKLYTAKQAISVVSEGLEAFGGQGYIEDTGLPSLLRDSQVLPIWEGTTNILSLDVLRSITKTNGENIQALVSSTQSSLETGKRVSALSLSCSKVERALQGIVDFQKHYPDQLVVAARDFAYSIARTYIGALLIENASSKDSTYEDLITASRWCELQDLCPLKRQQEMQIYSAAGTKQDSAIVMENYRKI